MFCTRCGFEMDGKASYCSQCGAATGSAEPRAESSGSAGSEFRARLTRPRDEKKIAGVCAGFARYLGMDVTLVRILWLILCFWPPCVGLIAYIICWIVMPKDPLPVSASFHTADATR
jgi:phage shock protein C